MNSPKVRAFLSASCILASSLIAMSAEIELRAVSISRSYPAGKVFLHEAKGKKDGVEILVKSFLNHESQTLKLDGTSLVFSAKADRASLEDESKFLGKMELGANTQSGILLFYSEGPDLPGKVEWVDDSAKSFPAGSVKFVNLSPSAIRVELEEKNYDCESEKSINIIDPPMRANNSSGMRGFSKEGAEWTQVTSGVWTHPGDKRILQIAVMNPRSKKVQFKSIRDIAKVGQ